MPQIKISHVVSFSSEDPQNPANNLLATEISKRKWLGAKGESKLSVVLQLEKSTQITSVHIGSYHSALVEILVNRSETPDQPFKVLVASSIFISPSDSRKNEPSTAVRSFSTDQLLEESRNERWDRIRVVCSQPYNKHCQFGLSFVNVFGGDGAANSDKQSTVSLGRFKLRPPSSDEEDSNSPSHFKPGLLFSKLKQESQLSTDAQIRQSVSPANLKNMTKEGSPGFLVKANMQSKTNIQSPKEFKAIDLKEKSRSEILYDAEDNEPNEKIDKLIEKDRQEKAKENKKISDKDSSINQDSKTRSNNEQRKRDVTSIFSKNKDKKNSPKKKENDKKEISANTKDRKRTQSDEKKPSTSAIKKPRTSERANRVPYNIIMKNVVFVFSGYVNPQRSDLRDKALAMGAKYRQDWTPDSTHLICAFPNTPKLHQVRKSTNPSIAIATGEWIEECHSKNKLLPWQWFATEPKRKIDRCDSPSPAPSVHSDEENISDGDTDDEIEKVMKEQMKKYSEAQKKKQEVNITDLEKDEASNIPKKQTTSKMSCSEDSQSSDATNVDDEEYKESSKVNQSSRINDELPETELQNGDYKIDHERTSPMKEKCSSAEEASNANDSILPDFFSEITFYIDPDVENEGFSRDSLSRYIIAYNGNIAKTLRESSEVNFILSFRNGDAFNVKNDSIRIVKPNWIWECNDLRKKVSFFKYLVR